MKHSAHNTSGSLQRTVLALGTLLLMVCASGANCPHFLTAYSPVMPRVLPATPTLADVISAVNTNSGRVQSLYTTDAEIHVPGMPKTRANIALDRPRRFRLRADTMLTGPEVDLGSNDELFWFWVRRSPEPAIFYCRHEQFASSAARQVLPVEPDWLIEVLGMATIDPAGEHTGPLPVGQGRLRVETRLPRPEGDLRRIMVIDDSRGLILEQHLYDPAGMLLASATLSNHRRDPLANVVLPRTVKIVWPSTKFEMTIELNNVAVNQLSGDPQQLWAMPTYGPSTPVVNLADPNLRLRSTEPEPPTPPPAYPERTDVPQTTRAPGGWFNRLMTK
ncbi:MAG TPA: hypothetical protein VGG64_14755 [Pirellulales bacterium]|jgi:hypothetical protein